jgi:membrane protease YdiL (CAAX protease family)
MGALILLPAIIGAWLANYGERNEGARYMLLILLGLTNLLILVLGALIMIAGQVQGRAGVGLPPGMPAFDFGAVGLAVVLTGLVAFLPMVPPLRRGLGRLIPIDPGSLVDTTALVYAIYLLGITVASWPIVAMAAEDQAFADEVLGGISSREAWLTALVFALLAVFGVGWLVRRDWQAVLARLGLRGLNLRQLAWAAAALAVLLVTEFGISLLWQRLDPAGYERVGGLSETFISPFLSPWGAVTIGLSAGIGEEMLFRGALQPRFGILLTTLVFTLAHAQYSLSPALIGLFVVGYGLGVTRNRIISTAAILVHAGFNFIQVILATYGGP